MSITERLREILEVLANVKTDNGALFKLLTGFDLSDSEVQKLLSGLLKDSGLIKESAGVINENELQHGRAVIQLVMNAMLVGAYLGWRHGIETGPKGDMSIKPLLDYLRNPNESSN